MNRIVAEKSDDQIEREWDAIAPLRAEHILSGRDPSFSSVLVPTILNLAAECDRERVADIGCGIGMLSAHLARSSGSVVGIDSSVKSIEIARGLHRDSANLQFVHDSLTAFAADQSCSTFSLVVTNMFLMNVRDLGSTLREIRTLLMPGGRFIFSITHPCFWPFYWNYSNEDWFDYWREVAIESTFRISLASYNELTTTHFHRPLERYIDRLHAHGFTVERILEPRPPAQIQAQYPVPWRYPRFLLGFCSTS